MGLRPWVWRAFIHIANESAPRLYIRVFEEVGTKRLDVMTNVEFKKLCMRLSIWIARFSGYRIAIKYSIYYSCILAKLPSEGVSLVDGDKGWSSGRIFASSPMLGPTYHSRTKSWGRRHEYQN
jgi:hypothetical protein